MLLREHNRSKQAELVMRGELTELKLSWSQMGDDSCSIVAEFLKDNESVHRVWLEGCNVGPRGAKAIAECLRLNKTIEFLNLTYNKIKIEGADALIGAFDDNIFIKDLLVGFCYKHQAIIQYLAETRNRVLVPPAVCRASLSLIAARRNIADAGILATFPKEIVRMIAM